MDIRNANIRVQYAYRMKLSKEDAIKLFVNTLMSKIECAKLTKNIQCAILCKTKGNSRFTDKAYKDAVKYYTKSLQLIPCNTDEEGIIYMARSVALKKLEAYKEAIVDAQRALKCRISEDLKKQLSTRITKLQTDLVKQLEKRKSTAKLHEDYPTVTYGENSEIPGASSAVTLSKDSESVRHLVTIRPIKAGDVILVQKPHVAIVDESGNDSLFTCHNCLKHYLAPIPCTACARTLYCSVKCRTDAYNNHKYECDVSACKGVEFTATLRMLITIANQGRKGDGRLVANCHRVIDSLASLVLANKEEDENDHTINYFASFMAVCLKTKTDFFGDDNDVGGLAHVILRLGYLFQANVIGIKCSSKNDIAGIAVYPVFGLLHSHSSNTISYTHGNTVKVLRASRDIAQGEQIFKNEYGAFSYKMVIQTERIALVNELYVLYSFDADYPEYTSRSVEKMKIPLRLQRRLRKSPTNIRYMWELMNFMTTNAKEAAVELDYMKMFLEDAYMGCESAWLRTFYAHIGIW